MRTADELELAAFAASLKRGHGVDTDAFAAGTAWAYAHPDADVVKKITGLAIDLWLAAHSPNRDNIAQHIYNRLNTE